MNTILEFDSLFVYSEKNCKYFFSTFDKGVNIIHGRNTSGKSTLLQSIIYTVGINNNTSQLKDIIDEEVFFRLDSTLTKDDISEKIIFIREKNILYIKRGSNSLIKFSGIGADNSMEHVKLKNYLAEIFDFSLYLESKNEYKIAPIEAMFLPYYVSQSVGRVSLYKSLGNWDYYKNFKKDYLDYYLGIEDSINRLEKHDLEKLLNKIKTEEQFYLDIEQKNIDFQVTKVIDEGFNKQGLLYIDKYKDTQENLIKCEKDYMLKCNELSFYIERKSILSKVKKNHKNQNPNIDDCVFCKQKLPYSISKTYEFLQDQNDTIEEFEKCKDKITTIQSDINSLYKKIENYKKEIGKQYETFNKYSEANISMDKIIEHKANVKLLDRITLKIGSLNKVKSETIEKLKEYKTEDEIIKMRDKKDREFSKIFKKSMDELGVKLFNEDKFNQIYKIYDFPREGVELLKTIMAYHFSMNLLILGTENIHRFPFVLDAIFKEDITPENKKVILKFIKNNKPKDTQLFISIAEEEKENNFISECNKKYFNNQAKLVSIGNNIQERAFLTSYNNDHQDFLEETLDLINGSNLK